MASEQFSLCWDNFHKNMSSGMNSLLENEDLVDVTLAVEGKYLKAHKMVLSVCSPYFKELFKSNPCQHPIVFMKDVSYVAISDLLQFMYQGEVQVSQDNLTTFIKTAEALQIKGLTGDGNGSTDAEPEQPQEKSFNRHVEETYKPASRPKKPLPNPIVTTTATKRPRLSVSSNDSQSATSAPVPPPVTKTEPGTTPASDGTSHPVQFKMEPYDQNQSVTIPDDTGDDNFGDDTLDDTAVDDTEDYAMMEGEEPQAGTSTDGAGEGQGRAKGVSRSVVVDGFTYHQNSFNSNTSVRYYICSEYKRLVCKARASLLERGDVDDLTVTIPHNHPPTPEASRKVEFVRFVKMFIARDGEQTTLRDIYNVALELYPDAKQFYPYLKVAPSMRRWRLQAKKGSLKLIDLYLSCAEFRKTGCRGRATLPLNSGLDKLRVTQNHNHPPDMWASERLAFLTALKNAVRTMEMATLKKVYETISEKYLKCAMFKEVNCKASYVANLDGEGLPSEYRCVVKHNHPSNEFTLQSARFLKELQEAVKTLPGSTKNIFDCVISSYPEVKEVYTYNNVVGRMHHWLKKYNVHGRYRIRSSKSNQTELEDA